MKLYDADSCSLIEKRCNLYPPMHWTEKVLAAAVSKMAFGNKLGVTCQMKMSAEETLFAPGFGNIVAEVPADKVADRSSIEAAGLPETTALLVK